MERLESDVARAALAGVAARGSVATFVSRLTAGFGADVQGEASQALHKALMGGKVDNLLGLRALA